MIEIDVTIVIVRSIDLFLGLRIVFQLIKKWHVFLYPGYLPFIVFTRTLLNNDNIDLNSVVKKFDKLFNLEIIINAFYGSILSLISSFVVKSFTSITLALTIFATTCILYFITYIAIEFSSSKITVFEHYLRDVNGLDILLKVIEQDENKLNMFKKLINDNKYINLIIKVFGNRINKRFIEFLKTYSNLLEKKNNQKVFSIE